MPLEQTLTSNVKVRINPQYPVIAGVDKDRVPQLIKVKPDGTLDLGGVTIPPWDTIQVTYVGSTNNVNQVIYKLSGNQVAHWAFTYLASGAANDDLLIGATFAIP